MKDLFERVRVIPVLIFPAPEYAAPTAAALIAGGLPVLEVTLRTDTAWQSLAAIIAAHPEATVGVGTVLEPEQMIRAKEAGAAFAVSPGFDPALADVARVIVVPVVPDRPEYFLNHNFGKPDDGVQRCTKLMADIGEKFRFRSAGAHCCFCGLPKGCFHPFYRGLVMD